MTFTRIFSIALLAALAPPTQVALAAAPFPDSETGRIAAAYVEAYNRGSDDVVRAFLKANVAAEALARRPVEERLGIFRQVRGDHGTLTAERLIEAGSDRLRMRFAAERGSAVELTFEFDEHQKLLGARFEEAALESGGADASSGPPAAKSNGPGAGANPSSATSAARTSGSGGAAAPGETPAARMSEADAIAAWSARLDSLTRADAFAGTVLLARGDSILVRRAYGLAERERGVPNRVDTRYNLGSINKIFTKLAIGQLVEQGKVKLDDTIDHYLPDYPRAVASQVTVRQLLEHRGGIGDVFGAAYDRADHSKLRTVADWIPLFRDQPLAFAPGTSQRYSNGGYVLLGAIVEQASGEDYYDYVRRHITAPLGMKDTEHEASDPDRPNRASGYTHEREGGSSTSTAWKDNDSTRPMRGSPAGGGYSTVDDLLRFTRAIRAGKVLRPETVRNGFAELGPDERGEIGLGIGGGAPGINAAVELQGPYTVIVLANLDPPAAEDATVVRDWLPGSGARPRRLVRMGHGAAASTEAGAPRATMPGAAEGGVRRRVAATGAESETRIRRGGPEGGATAPEPARSSIPASGVDVTMLRRGHMPAVDVMVNGQGPFRFAIDTGGGGSARLDSGLVAKLGLEVIGEAMGADPSGKNARRMDLVAIGSLEIGGARFEGLTAAVRNYNLRGVDGNIDGILGFGLFKDCLLTLDYPANRVRIERGELPGVNGRDVLAFSVPHGIPAVRLQVDTVWVDADVDAGSMGGFTLPERLIDRLHLASPPRVVGHARTVSNEFDIKEARLAGTVRLGGLEFPDATVSFQPIMPFGNVGSRVLRDFRVTFDQKNGRLRMVRGQSAAN